MEAKEKVYKAFYNCKKEWLYFTELKNITKLSNSSLQNILKKLIIIGEIEEDKQTSNIFYKIADSKKHLIFTLIDKERFDNLNPEVRIPLKNLLKKSPHEIAFIILFGSSSRKQEKEESDIDLIFVLYKFNNPKLQASYEKEIKQKIGTLKKAINSESNHPLNIIFINEDDFKISRDYLIMQAKQTGFPIYGAQQYYIKNEKN